ncbi:kinase-like domain-containing protein [Glomus cerebriforme]|uniref:Kinase-like domain-containing protein n=1 Tax=Glomus cerebriforme TaxID=658196 RepID=A0A397SCA0_9GLOM|nr:kinase-like domain-containing protein [Glomus cerebriforme]
MKFVKFIRLLFRIICRTDWDWVCKECYRKNTGPNWCNACNAKRFQQNFKKWRSGNDDIDKFIQHTQLSATHYYNITSHHIIITDYPIFIIRLYGITQDPETKNYMMVLQYAEDGSLRNYLDTNYQQSNWKTKLRNLWNIAFGLEEIHDKELIHRDLHIGNILHTNFTCITDMGLCKPADYNTLENTTKRVYGVLPYIAPEVLRGQNYTKASDVYSLGIIMYEVISGLPPYHDVSHDENLALKICQGLRPRFNIKVPQLIVHLIKKCLDANPLSRPTAKEIRNSLWQWYDDFKNQEELQKQIKEADEINNSLSTGKLPLTSLSYETHSENIYTSRLLNFKNLPEPKNSDDYYEQYDNIISLKYPESLQIDISQLKINVNAEERND